jgi:hypothetical protein
MTRNILSGIIAAALLPAGSLWAAPNTVNSAAQYLNQVNEQAYQIQAQADRLDASVRSGSSDWITSASYTAEMSEGAKKLLVILDQVAVQPGATNDTRIQVEKMKNATAEVIAFASNALDELGPRALALHSGEVFTNTANIEALCGQIRSTAQNLGASR